MVPSSTTVYDFLQSPVDKGVVFLKEEYNGTRTKEVKAP